MREDELKPVIVSEITKIVPGLYSLINMVANRMYNRNFEDLFIEEPNKAFEVLKTVLGDETAAEYFIQTIARSLLKEKATAVKISRIIKVVKAGSKSELLRILNVDE